MIRPLQIDQIHGLKRVFDAQFDSRRQRMHGASLGGSLTGKVWQQLVPATHDNCKSEIQFCL